jgi:hypothetical protein
MAGYYCPAGSDIATKVLCPVGYYCPAGSGAPTACPANHDCLVTGLDTPVCSNGFTLVGSAGSYTCEFADEPCSIPGGAGRRNTTTGTCEVEHCNPGYHPSADGLGCESDLSSMSCPVGQGWGGSGCEPCDIDNAIAYKLVVGGECVVDVCKSGYHLVGNECISNTESCAVQNGEGERAWANGSWGSCAAVDCDADHHIENSLCVPDTRSCNIADGSGVQNWVGGVSSGRWGDCGAESCNPGFTSDRSLTNDWTVPCGRCNNYYGDDGLPAVGSYSSGCDIAVCMHQGEKYIPEGDECVPICESRSDETGTMLFNSSTNKCQRTCETGYVLW